jgi:hypothetical protein
MVLKVHKIYDNLWLWSEQFRSHIISEEITRLDYHTHCIYKWYGNYRKWYRKKENLTRLLVKRI